MKRSPVALKRTLKTMLPFATRRSGSPVSVQRRALPSEAAVAIVGGAGDAASIGTEARVVYPSVFLHAAREQRMAFRRPELYGAVRRAGEQTLAVGTERDGVQAVLSGVEADDLLSRKRGDLHLTAVEGVRKEGARRITGHTTDGPGAGDFGERFWLGVRVELPQTGYAFIGT